MSPPDPSRHVAVRWGRDFTSNPGRAAPTTLPNSTNHRITSPQKCTYSPTRLNVGKENLELGAPTMSTACSSQPYLPAPSSQPAALSPLQRKVLVGGGIGARSLEFPMEPHPSCPALGKGGWGALVPRYLHSLDMPTSKHFWRRQYWQRLRVTLLMIQFLSRWHVYTMFFWMLRRKKPCGEHPGHRRSEQGSTAHPTHFPCLATNTTVDPCTESYLPLGLALDCSLMHRAQCSALGRQSGISLAAL